MVRDLDLQFAGDAQRLEVVADGLPPFGGARLAFDTTLVSALHANGEPRRRAAEQDGAALVAARRRKERTDPELVGLGHTGASRGAGRGSWWEVVSRDTKSS